MSLSRLVLGPGLTLGLSALLWGAPPAEPTRLWTTPPVLWSVESVLLSPEEAPVLYVSNLGRSETPGTRDGDGSIGRLAPDGTVLEAEWITGLNGPKGMGWWQGRLYVADIDRVVVIDPQLSRVVDEIPIAGAVGLNDLSIGGDGRIYISDHPKGCVHAVRPGAPSEVLTTIVGPNGVLWHEGRLYILARGGWFEAQESGPPRRVLGGFDPRVDGIESLEGDEFIVSCSSGVIYQANRKTGVMVTLFDGRDDGIQTADIAVDRGQRIIYVPTLFRHQVFALQLP